MERVTVTNEKFLSEVFRDKPKGQRIWVCSFPDDPENAGDAQWKGRVLDKDALSNHYLAPENNNFFGLSLFHANGSGTVLRRIECFAGLYVVVIDDIGTGPGAKISPDRIRLDPSFVIETSPDCFQYGYMLTKPISDRFLYDRFVAALIDQGLSADKDPGMAGVTRYMRLPVGVNRKVRKYGKPFEHVTHCWEPSNRYTLEDLIVSWKLSLDEVTNAGDSGFQVSEVFTADNDPYFRELTDLGLVRYEKSESGKWEITCPWVNEHTGQVDNGTAYWIGGGFQCHHGHCEGRTFVDVIEWLRTEHGIDTDHLDALKLAIDIEASGDMAEDMDHTMAEATGDPEEEGTPQAESNVVPQRMDRESNNEWDRYLKKNAGKRKAVVYTFPEDVELPPGLVGEIAKYTYLSAVKPQANMAIPTGLAVIANASQNWWRVGKRTCLNLYQIVICSSAGGKDWGLRVVSDIHNSCLSAPVGNMSSKLASGRAMFRGFSENPCSVEKVGTQKYRHSR